MLAQNTFAQQNATCNEMGGQLAWFDTTDEYDTLTDSIRSYSLPFGTHLFTGNNVIRDSV